MYDALRAKLESEAPYEGVAASLDALALLNLIKKIAFNFESQKDKNLTVVEALHHLYVQRQGKHMTCQAYLEQFTNN